MAQNKVIEWVGALGQRDAGRRTPAPPAAPPPAAPPPAPALAEALAARLAVLCGLWGEGFTGPGGEEEALRLAKPLGLSGSHSVLHLGAGLGGGTRVIARSSGAYVTGFEADAALAEAANAAALKAGLGKRAAVLALDARQPAIRPGYFHHALGQEALWPLADKEPVLAALVAGVKPGGQLMLTDLVRAEDDPADAAWNAWAVLERAAPHPASERAMGRALAAQGLDIRVVEDITQRHVTQALGAWMHRVALMRNARPSPRQAAELVREAELWLRRCRLMQEGRIRLLRWHAIRLK